MARETISKSLTGMEGLTRVLQGLPNEMKARLLASAVTEAAKPIARFAKMLAPKDTGALQASIATKTVNNPERATALALVGPDRHYYRGGKRVGKNADRRGADRPANYAHLLEFGHVAVQPRKGTSRRHNTAKQVGFVPPRPFIRPALVLAEPEIAVRLQSGLSKGIEAARKRLIS